jgi:diguanylate cyclase (GGDEF)-like protein
MPRAANSTVRPMASGESVDDEELLAGLLDRAYVLAIVNKLLDGLARCDTMQALTDCIVPSLLEVTGADTGLIAAPNATDALPLGAPRGMWRQVREEARATGHLTHGVHGGRYYAALPLSAMYRSAGELWLTGGLGRIMCLADVQAVLEGLAGPLALAIANIGLIADLKEAALLDGLTGLFNHAHFQTRLQAEVDRARRYGTGFSLVMIDVDHFKRINDTHGHPTGDRVLFEVAEAIKRTIRQSDLAARYGGEEFVLLLPETSPAVAGLAAGRVRAAIRAIDVTTHDGKPVGSVSASFGVASFRIGSEDARNLLQRADDALYQAKQAGRDAVFADANDLPSTDPSFPADELVTVVAATETTEMRSGKRAVDAEAQISAAICELERVKSDFLANTSHELRTPLAAIVGFAEFLEDDLGGPLTPEQRGFVSQIQTGAERLRVLVDNMLDMSRVEANAFELVRQEADLVSIARDSAKRHAHAIAEAQLELHLSVEVAQLPALVDANRVGQALEHLLMNAIKFTPEGGRVDLRLIQSGGVARFEVRDSGIGIPQSHHSQLFQKFFQVDPSITRLRQGAGLGLYITRSLVEAHGGNIGFESEFGDGSLFWFTVPLVAVGKA